MELRKSYKGFVIWIVAFCVISIGIPCLVGDNVDEGIILRLIGNICTISLAVLAFVIYKTEYVYWYTGISFEEALKAGSERRKKYAWKHLVRFGSFALIILGISVVSRFLHLNCWFDFTILCVGLIVTAVSTIPLKL